MCDYRMLFWHEVSFALKRVVSRAEGRKYGGHEYLASPLSSFVYFDRGTTVARMFTFTFGHSSTSTSTSSDYMYD